MSDGGDQSEALQYVRQQAIELRRQNADAPPSDPTPPATVVDKPHKPQWSRWEVIGCFLLFAAAVQICFGPKIRISQWQAEATSNAGIAEGLAWVEGRFDITPPDATDEQLRDAEFRMHDTAYYNGKVYNVFPPLVSIITLAFQPLHSLLEAPSGFWLTSPYVFAVFWPIPIVSFIVFYRRIGNPIWAAVLALGFIGGTALLPNLHYCRTGYLGQLDHVISQVGLLIFAADMLGRQRIWPGLIGLLISTYTRQITFLYGIVLLIVAMRKYGFKGLAGAGIGLVVIAAPLLFLNYQKFDNPLDFGYRYIYVGRETGPMGSRVQEHGVFSSHFIHENLYFMHAAPPRIDNNLPIGLHIKDDNEEGTSLWITTPLALWILLSIGHWWREPAARFLFFGTILVMAVLSFYHSPGYIQHGYSRFALDFLPIWLVIVAPFVFGGEKRWRSWLTLTCIAWSLLYFQSITPDSQFTLRKQAAASIESGANHGSV